MGGAQEGGAEFQRGSGSDWRDLPVGGTPMGLGGEWAVPSLNKSPRLVDGSEGRGFQFI